jgi:fibronectin type 3 domain-containing protein
VSRSFAVYAPLIDSNPPIAPTWLSGSMDTNGIVTLKLKGNTERDLMGYRLLKANAEEHEFSPFYESYADPDAPEARRTTYNDTVTIRSLTKYVYYKAIALDKNYNESPLSGVIAVPRPDKVAPVAPVITAATPTDSSVEIEFVPSSSEDVRTQILMRCDDDNKMFQPVAETSANSKMISDRTAKAGTTYNYMMQAIDSAGNRSKWSGIVSARPYPRSVAEGVHDLVAAPLDNFSAITLKWVNPAGKPRIVLYRGMMDKPVQQYIMLANGEQSFLDKNIQRGIRYSYGIKVFDADSAESRMSNLMTIDIPK